MCAVIDQSLTIEEECCAKVSSRSCGGTTQRAAARGTSVSMKLVSDLLYWSPRDVLFGERLCLLLSC